MKHLICIVCPNSCRLTVADNGEVSGHKCKRGISFAQSEMTNPMRSICSTVKSNAEGYPVIPVKTSAEVSRNKIPSIMKALGTLTVDKDVVVGEVIIANVADSGVDIVSTANTTRR